MKKIFCILLVFSLFVSFAFPSSAISSYSAYSYWSSAQNVINWVGNNITSNAEYSNLTGITPPSSIQSEFYRNGYYSNKFALFTDNAEGVASLNPQQYGEVFSWSYNGVNGTSPLDEGFELSRGATISLNDSGAVLGPSNGSIGKTMSYNTDEVVAIYEARLSTSGVSDSTNYGRIGIYFDYQGAFHGVTLTLSKIGINFSPITVTEQYDSGFGTSKPLPFSSPADFHDYLFIVAGKEVTLFIDGSLYGTVITGALDDTSLNSPSEPGLYFSLNKYQTMTISSLSASTIAKPTATIIANLGKPINVPSGNEIEFYINLRNGMVTNVTQQNTIDFDFTIPEFISVGFDGIYIQTEIEVIDDWILVNVPSSSSDRTFTDISFGLITPYVQTNVGDLLTWSIAFALSDVIIGDPDDIGYNPDIDPGENQFRDEVIGGLDKIESELGDVNNNLESIEDILNTPPDMDEFEGIKDIVNGIYDDMDRYVFDKYPNFPPIPSSPSPDFVDSIWRIIDEIGLIGIPLQSRNLNWLTFNSDDNVFRLKHYIVWYTTIFLTRAFIYAISEAAKAKNNPIQGDGDD